MNDVAIRISTPTPAFAGYLTTPTRCPLIRLLSRCSVAAVLLTESAQRKTHENPDGSPPNPLLVLHAHQPAGLVKADLGIIARQIDRQPAIPIRELADTSRAASLHAPSAQAPAAHDTAAARISISAGDSTASSGRYDDPRALIAGFANASTGMNVA